MSVFTLSRRNSFDAKKAEAETETPPLLTHHSIIFIVCGKRTKYK
jgi:hypothetical protein